MGLHARTHRLEVLSHLSWDLCFADEFLRDSIASAGGLEPCSPPASRPPAASLVTWVCLFSQLLSQSGTDRGGGVVLKQQKSILAQFWRTEVQNRGQQAWFLLSQTSLLASGASRLVDASPRCSHGLPPCASLCPKFPFLEGQSRMG